MNTQQKVAAAVVLLIILIASIIFFLWKNGVIFSSTMQAIPQQNLSYIYDDSADTPQTEDEIIMETDTLVDEGFKPLKSTNSYQVLSLSESTKYKAIEGGHPSPNLSLYNVNTQSYMTGLGDPIRGDLFIEPRNSEMFKSKYSQQDARIGALTSIA